MWTELKNYRPMCVNGKNESQMNHKLYADIRIVSQRINASNVSKPNVYVDLVVGQM